MTISRAAPCSSIRRRCAGQTAARSDETGHNQFDLHVHDNLIHGDSCNGINFATVDPSKGPVEAYNNVIYHVGVADPKDGGGAFSCIYVAGITNHRPRRHGHSGSFQQHFVRLRCQSFAKF